MNSLTAPTGLAAWIETLDENMAIRAKMI